ncbi:hypothetical protein RJ639_006743 [Escallonia herrerae]|uniref:Uncharacterized protein n=1 Tax=Escallonia herrerae TaxID=1293975 RepID=A0AA89AW78_9ASTE|nr:hypothetical protein RJ639_006743 [Escallonia herrerae]
MATETVTQDQKKRTFDALERRFALAEAELHQQKQQKNKIDRVSEKINPLAAHPPRRPAVPPSSNASPMKDTHRVTAAANDWGKTYYEGGVTTNSSTAAPPQQHRIVSHSPNNYTDAEPNDPTYLPLSHPVHENLASTNVKFSGKGRGTVDQILHELLQKGDSAQKYMQGSRSKKIDNWILLDNLVQGRGTSGGARMRALKVQSKRSKKHMSMKQHKRCGSLNLPQEFHNFEMFKPMHEMWKGYIMQLLKTVGKNQLAQCLLSADLHGAVILVAQCKIDALAGVSGIMVRETTETFGLITQDNKFRVVPKKVSVFMLQIDCWKITLLGDKLTSRNMGP